MLHLIDLLMRKLTRQILARNIPAFSGKDKSVRPFLAEPAGRKVCDLYRIVTRFSTVKKKLKGPVGSQP
jgi:hypothetical protein